MDYSNPLQPTLPPSKPSRPVVCILGTCDTKLEETLYVREQVINHGGCDAMVIDIGCTGSDDARIVTNIKKIGLALHETEDPMRDVSKMSRNEFVDHAVPLVTAFIKMLRMSGFVHGLINAGGSTGTSLSAPVMRNAVPVGFPKLLVSTMASGDVSPYVDNVDVTMMYSVVDIAGLNFLSKAILANAASAIASMAQTYFDRTAQQSTTAAIGQARRRRRTVALSMFGVTTPACDAVRKALTEKHDCEVVVFHATGAGGRAMERLITEGAFDAVVDLTTTEVADELVGGVLSAGPERLRAAARAGIPQVVSVGACDMVNFGPKHTVPEKWTAAGRNVYVHNPGVTLMRTTPDECQRIGQYIAKTLMENATKKHRVKVMFPMAGVSMIAGEGGPFHDPEADTRLLSTLKQELGGSGIELIEVDEAINDEGFANKVVEQLMAMLK